ncbi:sodium/calcium exchanger NCL-like [Euphorbia lathyris]|uniref:sodium/calcium exchanger NCL-like n=1 Tax=Euphorbia lathyris TaxID=212925 RepID=UPI00331418D5
MAVRLHLRTIIIIISLLLLVKIHGHRIRSATSNHQEISVVDHLEINSSILSLKPLNCTQHACIHYYGFLPCATNIPGYIFQIVILEYLLLVGDKILTKGRQQLFSLFGVGIYGATLFRLLQVLPNIALVLASGLAKDSEAAKVTIENGVGSLAGSTVFYLTLQWGICVLLGISSSAEQHQSTTSSAPISKLLLLKHKLSRLKENGVETDKYTRYTAGIMLLSLLPLILVELASSFKCQPWGHIIILTMLSAALVIFSVFQSRHKWIQERSLEYSRDQLLLAGFLGHLQTFAKTRLVNDQGKPDVSCLRRAFVKIDKDGNQDLSQTELREFLQNMDSENLGFGQDAAIDELMKHFDQDSNKKITLDEFVHGIQRFIDDAKKIVVDKHESSRKYLPWLHQIIKPGNQKTEEEESIDIEKQLSKMLKTQQLAGLLTDGKPDQDKIRSLFKESDTNKDGKITLHELKGMIMTKFKSANFDRDAMGDDMMRTLDKNKDNELQEDEFVEGITKGLSDGHDDSQLIAQCIEKEKRSIKKMSLRALTKAIFRVIIGIAIVTSLVLPLINNTQRLSESIGIPTFFVSFVVLPFAVNFKTAVANIFPASQKKENAASIMFSEIYGAVFMNNIMGLLTIIGLIWARGFAWEYSAEVLVMWVVGAIIGLIAYTNKTYSLWTCILAFSFYPLSLVLYYIIRYLVGWK